MEDIRLWVRSNVKDHDKPDNKKERLTFQKFRSDYSPPALPSPIPFPLANDCWYHSHHHPASDPKWLLRPRKVFPGKRNCQRIPTGPTTPVPALLRQSERNGGQRRRSGSRVSGNVIRSGAAVEEAWQIGWFWERSHLFSQIHIKKFSFSCLNRYLSIHVV